MIKAEAASVSGPLSLQQPVARRPALQSYTTVTPAQRHLSIDPAHFVPQQQQQQPWIEIVEHPKQADLRFRYKCEGRSAGSLLGERSSNDQKSYPTIKIHNFDGSAAIVVVSCVSNESPHWPHPHNLVGNDCHDGVCTVKVKGHNQVSFTNIGIQCVTKRDVPGSLKTREKLQVNPFGNAPPTDIATIDLTSVRLCFQVFLPDANRKFTRIVQPAVSKPIFDKKAVHNLVICRLSRQSGYAQGGDEVFLLCEKINKDDIQVRFFEESDDGICWEAFGQFTPQQDVHHQYAVVFQTPAYRDELITAPAQVFIQLRRPSDESTSEPKPFQYIPVDSDPYQIEMKRKRLASDVFDHNIGIPASVLPLALKDEDDDSFSSAANLKMNLKKKVERRIQRKELSSATASSVASSSYLPQYTFDSPGVVSAAPAAEVTDYSTLQTIDGQPIIAGSDGRYYALVATSDGHHQLVELDVSGATHDAAAAGGLPDIVQAPRQGSDQAAVDLSNSG